MHGYNKKTIPKLLGVLIFAILSLLYVKGITKEYFQVPPGLIPITKILLFIIIIWYPVYFVHKSLKSGAMDQYSKIGFLGTLTRKAHPVQFFILLILTPLAWIYIFWSLLSLVLGF